MSPDPAHDMTLDDLAGMARALEAADAAYMAGSETMADIEYDRLMARYTALAARLGVPQAAWYWPPRGIRHGDETMAHRTPMLGLPKLRSWADVTVDPRPADCGPHPSYRLAYWQLHAWLTRCQQSVGISEDLKVTLTPKYDGVAVALTYVDGQLRSAALRGNGYRGQLVTAQVMASGAAPGRIPWSGTWEVHGELVMAADSPHAKRGSTPRAAVAGLIRSQSAWRILPEAGILFVAWSVGAADTWHRTRLCEADEAGFAAPRLMATASGLGEVYAEVLGMWSHIQRAALPCDGVVLTLDDTDLWPLLGATAEGPCWARAYKPPLGADVARAA